MNEQDSRHDRDAELDRLLEGLRKTQPTSAQMSKWQQLAPKSHSSRRSWKDFFIIDSRRIMDFALAASLGFVIGATLFSYRQKMVPSDSEIFFAKNTDLDATIERVYDKGE